MKGARKLTPIIPHPMDAAKAANPVIAADMNEEGRHCSVAHGVLLMGWLERPPSGQDMTKPTLALKTCVCDRDVAVSSSQNPFGGLVGLGVL